MSVCRVPVRVCECVWVLALAQCSHYYTVVPMSPCGFAAPVIALMWSSADGGDTYPFDLPSL